MRRNRVHVTVDFENVMEAGSFMLAILSAHPSATIDLNSFEDVHANRLAGIDGSYTPVVVDVPVSTGADPDAPPVAEVSAADVTEPPPAEARALTLPEQKAAKDLFNKFTRKQGIAEGVALLAKFEARRWSELTPEQMGLVVAEIEAKSAK